MMENEPPFYVVWADGGAPPTVKQSTPEIAEAEAKRLAKATKGKTFFVCAVITSVTVGGIEIERFDPNAYVPF
jgi:hypothetical protein